MGGWKVSAHMHLCVGATGVTGAGGSTGTTGNTGITGDQIGPHMT